MSVIRIYANLEHLAAASAEHILLIGEQEIARRGYFSLMLSGGSTPRPVYQLLSQPGYIQRLRWERVFVFWGDERCVRSDHPDSNYRMAWETLLSKVPIPQQNIYRIPGEMGAEKAAATYAEDLNQFFARLQQRYQDAEPGAFSLILLGLGTDGHTASLFPGSPALDEKKRWVVAVDHHQPPPPLVPRVTVTLPLINAAKNVTFLVSGEEKAVRLQQVLEAVGDDHPLPAQYVQPQPGQLSWFLDNAAASRLNIES